MLKTLGMIEACYRDESARSKVRRKLGGKSVLEWVVRRATDCQQFDGVIVVAADAPENRFLSRLVPSDVPVFYSKKPDPLGAFAHALEEYPAEGAVRISSACPFVDPALIDRLVVVADSHPDCDYVGYGLRDGRPAAFSPVGVYAEWFRAAALHRASKRAASPEQREKVTAHLLSHPDKFRARLIPAPERIDREDVRLTVDIEEDWEHALAIFEALGPDELDWQRIADLLHHQPALRLRMAALNRAHART